MTVMQAVQGDVERKKKKRFKIETFPAPGKKRRKRYMYLLEARGEMREGGETTTNDEIINKHIRGYRRQV